jgi:hypothetical protein
MPAEDGKNASPDIRRHERVSVGENFRATLTDSTGAKTDAVVLDVSAGGAGLNVVGAFQNDAFVELHMGSFGKISGRVARKFVEGIGVEFAMDEAEQKRFKEALIAFRKAGGREAV